MDAARHATGRPVGAAAMLLMLVGGGPSEPVEPPAPKAQAAIVWRKHWAGALQEARAKKQPVLLVVAFPTCKWWLRMERTTFADPRIQAVLSSMVPVLLHGEDDGILFEKFKVAECPLIAICDATGKEIARVEGLQEATPFLGWLKRYGPPAK